ncbi:uncharacterized protein LOC135399489 [Ornithodoros turicata]|uniref:uncharacterized protein LOC135399489 n=1 Tax=Ornithodoros turicata TaxID=34597 RepID=UPI003138F9D6
MDANRSKFCWETTFFLLLLLLVLGPSNNCRDVKFDPRRLLRAKASFGKLMRACKVEFDAAIAATPQDGNHKRVDFFCDLYSSCVGTVPENTTVNVFSCMRDMMLDKELQPDILSEGGSPYTKLIDNVFLCANRTVVNDLSVEDLEFALSFIKRFMYRFG